MSFVRFRPALDVKPFEAEKTENILYVSCEEQIGTRINLNRIDEVLSDKPDSLCVSCPYCLTMFVDGLKDLHADQTQVKDIAEVVAEGLKLIN